MGAFGVRVLGLRARLWVSLYILFAVVGVLTVSCSALAALLILTETAGDNDRRWLENTRSSIEFIRDNSQEYLNNVAVDPATARILEEIGQTPPDQLHKLLPEAIGLLNSLELSAPYLENLCLVTRRYVIHISGVQQRDVAGVSPAVDAVGLWRQLPALFQGDGDFFLQAQSGPGLYVAGFLSLEDFLQPTGDNRFFLFDSSQRTLYSSGDTVWFEDLYRTAASSYGQAYSLEPAFQGERKLLPRLTGKEYAVLGGQVYLMNSRESPYSGDLYVYLSGLSSTVRKLGGMVYGLLPAFLLTNLAWAGFSRWLSGWAMRPVRDLTATMNRERDDPLPELERIVQGSRRQMAFRGRIWACFLCTVAALLLFTVGCCAHFLSAVREEREAGHLQTMEQLCHSVDSRIEATLSLPRHLAASAEMQQLMLKARTGGAVSAELEALVRRQAGFLRYVRYVTVYNHLGEPLGTSVAGEVPRLNAELRSKFQQAYKVLDIQFDEYRLDGGRIIYAVRSYSSVPTGQYFDILGYLDIGLRDFFSYELIGQMEIPKGECYIFDRERWRFVVTPRLTADRSVLEGIVQAGLLQEETLVPLRTAPDRDEWLLYMGPVSGGRWMLLYAAPAAYLTRDNYKIAVYNLLPFAALLLSACLLAPLFVRMLTRPLERLRDFFQRVTLPQATEGILSLYGENEVGALALAFGELLDRYQTLTRASRKQEMAYYSLQKRKNELEFLTLQNQINPHFLYNILTSVRVLIHSGRTERAEELLSALGRFMRACLGGVEREVTLERELEYVRAYVDMERIRFPDAFSFEDEVPRELAQSCRVPIFLLQPIVENAIVHGMARHRQMEIRILGERRGDECLLRVSNTGNPLDQERLEIIHRILDGVVKSDRFGLASVNERVKLHCGSRFGLSVEPEAAGGLCVLIRLPLGDTREQEGNHVEDGSGGR